MAEEAAVTKQIDIVPEKSFPLTIDGNTCQFVLKAPTIRTTLLYQRYIEDRAIGVVRDHANAYGFAFSEALNTVTKSIGRGEYRWGRGFEWMQSFSDEENQNYLIWLVIEQTSPGNDQTKIMKALTDHPEMATPMWNWLNEVITRPNSQSPPV